MSSISQPILSSQLQKATVLIVDDDEMVRKAVAMRLKLIGIGRIIETSNAKTALEKIRSGEVDLVICDWHMPTIRGIDLLKEVRQYDLFQKLPFLMLTSDNEKSTVMEAIHAGVTDFILKSHDGSTIAYKVASLLEKHYKESGLLSQGPQ